MDNSDTFSLRVNITQESYSSLMNYNYIVEISEKGIAKFTSVNSYGPKMEYWIATEAKSNFERGN